MYDRHLDAFIALAEAKSFAAAAKRLYISRLALSQQVSLLERDIGLKLIERHHHGITLTEAGAYFYGKALKYIAASRMIISRAREIACAQQEVIRIGTLPNFSLVLLSDICRAFRAQYPTVKVQFVERTLEEFFQSFVYDAFDIAAEYMLGYHFDARPYSYLKLMEDRHYLAVPARHPLAEKKLVRTEDLEGVRIMMYAEGITRSDDALRSYLSEHVPDIEIVDIKEYSSNLALKCEMEDTALVIYSMYEESFPDLRILPFEPAFPIDIGLLYKENARAVVQNFAAVARALYPLDAPSLSEGVG